MLMCKDLAEIASDYIDGELSTPQSLAVRMHLMMCKHCRSFIGNLRASTDLIQAHSYAEPDEEMMCRIDQRIAEALKARKKG
ncbi:MAG: zf-HC2 domain-containing protein [Gammaproteobacteria bacterium]|uniref:Putative zinc-finger domain-containing protein n=1 Tax=Marinobacter litoralis TaxID=187981 RepID=A0A3M2RBX1_9GAMM|nr:zf-HC2 domain-containing protein [Marinobacter litoralis]MBR9870344.1 zf-HC2 domain-containing protein [Gammaproteobacteria bacterium]RMJ02797.1 hypothetical protein DOQ08_02261 [Marinobacter litoralis]